MTGKEQGGARGVTRTDLLNIPGVAENMKRHLQNIGIGCVGDLKGQSPDDLYNRSCVYSGCNMDRCVLYVYRLAVYYAENEAREPEKLKWWNWKD